MDRVIKILMRRDDMTEAEFIFEDMLGLEPDHIVDIL